MFTEGCIAILQVDWVKSFIYNLFELFHGNIEYCPLIARRRVMFLELTKAEWIDDEIFVGCHDFTAAVDLTGCSFGQVEACESRCCYDRRNNS